MFTIRCDECGAESYNFSNGPVKANLNYGMSLIMVCESCGNKVEVEFMTAF